MYYYEIIVYIGGYMKDKLLRLLTLLKSLLPINIPTTDLGLELLCQDVIRLGQWSDDDGFRTAVAHCIMQLGPQAIVKSRYFFYASVRAQLSKQVAINLMRAINEKQKSKDGLNEQQEAQATRS